MVRFSEKDGAELLARVNETRDKLKTMLCGCCGDPFTPEHNQARYCSPECRKEAKAESHRNFLNRKRSREPNRFLGCTTKCVDCGIEFTRRSPNHKHCDDCGRHPYVPKVRIDKKDIKYTRNTCRYCGKRFTEDSFCIDRRLTHGVREVKCACPQGRAGEYQLWDVAKIK